MVKNFIDEKEIYLRENQLDAFKKKIKPIMGRSINEDEFENIFNLKNTEFEIIAIYEYPDHKQYKVKVHNDNPSILGMIDKIKHLLKVEKVN